jgi:hypothetical protein
LTVTLRRTLPTLVWASLLLSPSFAHGDPIRFVATGNSDVVGFIEIDEAVLDGTNEQFVTNTNILNLSLVVAGYTFTIDDVVASDFTLFDSSVTPLLQGGAGILVDNGLAAVALFPSPLSQGGDGDATIRLQIPDVAEPDYPFYEARWKAFPDCSPFPGRGGTGGCFPGPGPFPVPEPALLPLAGIALAAAVLLRKA